MALTTKTPGVYIQEIQTLPASVAQVETAIPAFLGYTTEGFGLPPTRISSLVEYEEKFGGPFKSVTLTVAGSDVTTAVDTDMILFECLQLYFANGGGPCYIVSVETAATGALDEGDYTDGLTALSKEDEPTLIVMP
jgi:hypothetical protein